MLCNGALSNRVQIDWLHGRYGIANSAFLILLLGQRMVIQMVEASCEKNMITRQLEICCMAVLVVVCGRARVRMCLPALCRLYDKRDVLPSQANDEER